MAIKGSLKEASLPDVLQLLTLGQKTGCLAITDRTEFGYIYFDRGRIVYATIVNRRDRLGDILLKEGIITPEQLASAVEAQGKERSERIGELLVRHQALSRDVLNRYIQLQIEEAVYYLFRWVQGTFSFEADVHPDAGAFLVSINPESLLLEGARRVDEWSLIEKKIPSFDIIFDLHRGRLAASEAQFTPEQERLVPLINGRRDVRALVEESGLGEFEAGKALYGLITAGFLHRVGRSDPTDEREIEARVEEHRNLGFAFYKSNMLEEALREFRRVAELRPNVAQPKVHVGLVLLREGRWAEAAQALEAAAELPAPTPALFHNLAYAQERLGRLDAARLSLDEAMRRGGIADPRVHLSMAIVRLRLGDLEGARASLEASRKLFGAPAPAAAWFHYAALVTACGGETERALAILAEGCQMHPHSAPLRNLLAVIHERLGGHQAALAAAEEGIRHDPELAQLHRNVGDNLYRLGRQGEALDAYRRATSLAPALGVVTYFRIGNIHYKRQERDEAVAAWERALELDPNNDLIRTNLDLVRSAV